MRDVRAVLPSALSRTPFCCTIQEKRARADERAAGAAALLSTHLLSAHMHGGLPPREEGWVAAGGPAVAAGPGVRRCCISACACGCRWCV